MSTRALSGRLLEEITLEAAMAGELGANDLRTHPDALHHQAEIAERGGNPQLADNLRRAAELTAIDDAQLLRIYEALRPGRATRAQLEQLAKELSDAGASRCSSFVAEALEVYARRGLLRP
jgi:propanediol dehydratase small subunit